MRQRRAFAKLIAAADGYVLQVHSLAPPASPKGEIPLLKPAETRDWVERGGPFRAAVPGGASHLQLSRGVRSQGKLLGLSAEGPLLSWPEGIAVRAARSDPAVMAGLVRDWTRNRPRELAGILWYRLPVAGDRLNWTLADAAGRDGRTDAPRPRSGRPSASPSPGWWRSTWSTRATARLPCPPQFGYDGETKHSLPRTDWRAIR